ncbi:unnamed protein product [Arctogadus glacialis]
MVPGPHRSVHPTPRTFHPEKEHDSGPLHPHHPRPHNPPPPPQPPRPAGPLGSIHHITPSQAPHHSPTKAVRPEETKGQSEEYGRYHAEQHSPEQPPLSPASPLLGRPLPQTHPLLPGNKGLGRGGGGPREGNPSTEAPAFVRDGEESAVPTLNRLAGHACYCLLQLHVAGPGLAAGRQEAFSIPSEPCAAVAPFPEGPRALGAHAKQAQGTQQTEQIHFSTQPLSG